MVDRIEVTLQDFNRATKWWFDNKPEATNAGGDELAFTITKELAEHLGVQETKVKRFEMAPISSLPARRPQPEPVSKAKTKADPEATKLFDDVLKSIGSMEW